MLENEQILLIIYFVAVIFLLVTFVVLFFIVFQRRKNKFLLERLEAEKRFEKELADSQLEIQEQTFKNIAWELHDNVGQLLSVANIQLNILKTKLSDEYQLQVDETKGIVTESLQEIRNLSRSLNKDVILSNGLINSVQIEMDRFNRMNFLKAHLSISGNECCINDKDEIIIFRILQEFFSNVIKHAKADNLFVTLSYEDKWLLVDAHDDGVGFDLKEVKMSSGLINMKSRAKLIKAKIKIEAQVGAGVKLTLAYPFKNEN